MVQSLQLVERAEYSGTRYAIASTGSNFNSSALVQNLPLVVRAEHKIQGLLLVVEQNTIVQYLLVEQPT